MSLAHRLIRNQGATLKACVGLVKSCNAECGSACEPRRAGSETHIYCVALLTKDLGHLLRSASCICTFQNPQRYNIIDQRFLKHEILIDPRIIGSKRSDWFNRLVLRPVREFTLESNTARKVPAKLHIINFIGLPC